MTYRSRSILRDKFRRLVPALLEASALFILSFYFMNPTIRTEYFRVPSEDRTYIFPASRFDKIREREIRNRAPRRGAWFIRARRKSFIPQLSSRENILIRSTEFNSRSISAAVISRARFLSFSPYLSRSPLSLHWKYFSYLFLRMPRVSSIRCIILIRFYWIYYLGSSLLAALPASLLPFNPDPLSLSLSFAYFRHRNIRRHPLQR